MSAYVVKYDFPQMRIASLYYNGMLCPLYSICCRMGVLKFEQKQEAINFLFKTVQAADAARAQATNKNHMKMLNRLAKVSIDYMQKFSSIK